MILHLSIGRLRLDLSTEPQPQHDDYPAAIPTPMTAYIPDHEDQTVGFRHPSARTRKEPLHGLVQGR